MKKIKKAKAQLTLALSLIIINGFLITSYPLENKDEIKQLKIEQKLLGELKTKKGVHHILVELNDKNTKIVPQSENTVKILKDNAKHSQKNIINYLKKEEEKGEVKNIKSFYIINAICLEAEDDVIYELSKDSQVKEIYSNNIYKNMDSPNYQDTFIPYNRLNENNKSTWYVKSVGAEAVWRDYKIKGNNTLVGIIDIGTYYKSPLVKSRFNGYSKKGNKEYYKINGNFINFVGYEERKKEVEANSDYDRGTYVTGIILGQEKDENGKSIKNIGISPESKFICARAIDKKGGDAREILEAAQWMLAPDGNINNRPDVINNPWGGNEFKANWFQNIIINWRKAGIVPVFACGNVPYN